MKRRAKKQPQLTRRPAQLIAEAVAVCCPRCGDAQLNIDGSEMWTKEDFDPANAIGMNCVSCDAPMWIWVGNHAQFK